MSNSNKSDDIRNKCVKKINSCLKNEYISRCIEKDIYNSIIKLSIVKNIKRNWDNKIFKNLYYSKIISIYSNLDPNSYIKNKNFIKKVKNKELDINNISKLQSYDIFPEAWRELLNKKIKIDKIKYEKKAVAMTSLFKCKKCGSKECSYYEVQTRSADEPMTQFITCINCGNRWKE